MLFDILTEFLVGYSTTLLLLADENQALLPYGGIVIAKQGNKNQTLGFSFQRFVGINRWASRANSPTLKIRQRCPRQKTWRRREFSEAGTRDQIWTVARSAKARTVCLQHQQAVREPLWDVQTPSSIDEHPSSCTCPRCPTLQGDRP